MFVGRTLYNVIHELKKKTHSTRWGRSTQPLIHLFDLSKCNSIDERSSINQTIREKRAKILRLLDEQRLEFTKGHEEAFCIYNEICVFDRMSIRDSQIVLLSEKKKQKMPDFRTMIKGENLNLELKTLSVKNSDLNWKTYQAAMNRVDAGSDEWVKTSAVASDDIQMKTNQRNDVIEQIASRISKHYEKASQQLNSDGYPGLLVIDTILLSESLTVLLEDCTPFYHLNSDDRLSGCIWNAMFGIKGDKVYQPTTSSLNIGHAINRPGIVQLNHDGVFARNIDLNAAAFLIHTKEQRCPIKIVGVKRSGLVAGPLLSYLDAVCDYQIDESGIINEMPSF